MLILHHLQAFNNKGGASFNWRSWSGGQCLGQEEFALLYISEVVVHNMHTQNFCA